MARFPGERSRALIDELGRYVIAEPYPFVIDLPKSRGMWLATIDGDRVFDWAGYYASRLIGHNHPRLFEPDYAARLLGAANNKVPNPDFLTPECVEYYRLLYELAPLCMRGPRLEVYAINSGAEAVENMMKYLINRFHEKTRARGENPSMRRFVYFERAFHGRTIGTLNVTHLAHSPVVTKDFSGIIPHNIAVPFPHIDNSRSASENEAETESALRQLEECLQRYRGEVVALLVEPIQGAGGHRIASAHFFQELSRLAHAYDVYLAFDEVQTAGGQCGSLFAIDGFGLPHAPEAVAVAKKFGNGVVYMRESMQDRGVLDSTWGGSLTDMVRFVQEMKIVREEQLLEQVNEKAAHLVHGLRSLEQQYPSTVFNVRGLGLYQGLSLRRPEARDELCECALEREGLLLLPAGTQSIRLRPPLDVRLDEIEMLCAMLGRCLGSIA
jgi:L-lysine 6-transaminase